MAIHRIVEIFSTKIQPNFGARKEGRRSASQQDLPSGDHECLYKSLFPVARCLKISEDNCNLLLALEENSGDQQSQL